MDFLNRLTEYLKRKYPELYIAISPVTSWTFQEGKATIVKTEDFLVIGKTIVSAFREGLHIKDSGDFEERVYKYVNERLNVLGYV